MRPGDFVVPTAAANGTLHTSFSLINAVYGTGGSGFFLLSTNHPCLVIALDAFEGERAAFVVTMDGGTGWKQTAVLQELSM